MSNKFEGNTAHGGYQESGVGNSAEVFREATRKGKFPVDNTGPQRSQGESPGAGTIYSVMLNERPNMSNPRNNGHEFSRPCSRSAATPVPVVLMDTRCTGRVTSE